MDGRRCDSHNVIDCDLPSSTTGTRNHTRGEIRYASVVHDRTRMPYTERCLYKKFKEIERLSDSLILPIAIHAHARSICARVMKDPKFVQRRGRIRTGLVAWCVYSACIAFDVPRSMREIASMCGISTTILADISKLLDKSRNEPITGMHLVRRTCMRLDLPDKATEQRIVKATRDVLATVDTDRIPALCGRSPSAMVAGAIACVTTPVELTVARIASAAGVSIVTVNKIKKILNQRKVCL